MKINIYSDYCKVVFMDINSGILFLLGFIK